MYLGWQFTQFNSAPLKSWEKKTCSEYENIEKIQQISIQTQFEDVRSWLESQDCELYKPFEEDIENDADCTEETFCSSVGPNDCSTMKKEQFEDSYYSLQLRRKAKDIFEVVES